MFILIFLFSIFSTYSRDCSSLNLFNYSSEIIWRNKNVVLKVLRECIEAKDSKNLLELVKVVYSPRNLEMWIAILR